MRLLDQIRLRFRSLTRRAKVEGELDEEFRFHLERLAAQNLASGMQPAEARAAALRELGGVSQFKEECRDARGLNALDNLAQDVRYGLRMLRRNPGFSAVAVLSLALGIGANTAIFTLIHALLRRPLPVAHPEQLVQIKLQTPRGTQGSLSYFAYEFFRRQPELFSGVFVHRSDRFNVEFSGQPIPTEGAYVTGDYFSTLGISPLAGRAIAAADDQESGGPDGPVAVISHAFWIGRFGGDPTVLGRTIVVQRNAVRIIGVLPPSFIGVDVGRSPNLFLPLSLEPMMRRNRPLIHEQAAWWLDVLARRKAGLTDGQLRAGLELLWPRMLSDVLPRKNGMPRPEFQSWRIVATDASRGISNFRAEFTTPLYILMGIVGTVLLIACANVANLLLARTSARQREVAVRLSLGASRPRLVRQFLTESLMLSLSGAVLGIGFSLWGCRALLALLSTRNSTMVLDVWPDPPVLGFTALIAIGTGILFGTGPALRATGSSTAATLKQSSQAVAGRSWAASALVVSQVSLCLLLLVGAGLFVRTFWNLTHQNLGYDPRNLYVAGIDPRNAGYKGEALMRLYPELLEKLNGDPQVRSASLSAMTPIGNCCWFENIAAEGFTERPGEQKTVYLNNVSPGFFQTFGSRLIAGRDFSERDGPAGPILAVISESIARRYFAGTNPLGKHISVVDDKLHQNVEIIGVVEDMRTRGLREGTEYEAYFNLFQLRDPGNVIVEVRTGSELSTAALVLRRVVQSFNRQIPVNVESLAEQIKHKALRDRMTAVLAAFFGMLALVLACIGIYGIMSYTVIRRTSELGIRMALGAQAGKVTWMIVRQALLLTGLGASIGIPVAVWCTHEVTSLAALLFGLEPTDPATIAAVTLLLMGLAMMAAYLPARRAARLDPVKALRSE